MIWRGPMVHECADAVPARRRLGRRSTILVVDMPPGTGDAQLTLAQRVAAHRRGDRHDAAGREPDRRAQGPGDVPPGRRAGARHRREHELLRLPACGKRDDIFGHGGARADGREARHRFPRRDPARTSPSAKHRTAARQSPRAIPRARKPKPSSPSLRRCWPSSTPPTHAPPRASSWNKKGRRERRPSSSQKNSSAYGRPCCSVTESLVPSGRVTSHVSPTLCAPVNGWH